MFRFATEQKVCEVGGVKSAVSPEITPVCA